MANRGHVPPVVARTREQRALELVQQGVPQVEIAKQLEVTPAAITKMLQRIERRVLAELTAHVERQRARQTVRLEYLYGEALAAWERSKEPRKRSRRVVSGAKKHQVEQLDEAQTSAGDAGFLQAARDVLADQRELWGLNAPKRLHVGEDTRRPFKDLSDEDLAQRAAEGRTALQAIAADDDDPMHKRMRGIAVAVRVETSE
jgi:DNA-binding MarR family transcriptional regulator